MGAGRPPQTFQEKGSQRILFLVLRSLWASLWASDAVAHAMGIQSGGGQLHVQAIQHHRPQQSLAVPGQVGQQQAHRGCCHFGITGGQAIKPWALQPFQIRQTLKTRHLDVGRGGLRHGRLIATLQFGDGAGHTPSYAKPRPRHQSPAAQHAFSVQLAAHGEWVGL